MANAEAIARMFEHAGVPCRVSQTIEADLWAKMVMNCAYNAISALARARYGRIVRTSWARDLMQRAVEETVAVARAAGVPLEEAAMVEAAFQLGEAMAGARSSTAQDIGRGRPTEIDSLNGYVVRRGEALGVPTPVNRALWALVKLLEESAREERDAAGSSG
jgi:2-dehydropantoate 2-reductase